MAFGILYGLRLSGIYKITNTQNGKFYVGSSVQIESRIFRHLSMLRKGAHKNAHLQSAFAMYGEAAFDFSLLEACDKSVLLVKEQHHIDTMLPEYNICKIAGNTSGVLHTPESKAKMTAANMGNKRMLGRTHTEETKQKLRTKAVLRSHTEEVKAKISNALRGNTYTLGKKLSCEHVAKVAESSLRMWNGEDKQARRLAASDRAKARWADPVWRLTNAQKITDGKKAAKLARIQGQ